MESLGLGLIILISLMVIGVPVAMAFGALTLFLASAYGIDPESFIPTAYHKTKSVVLLAIPFYIIVGGLMQSAGLASRLIDLVNTAVGHIKGGLGAVTVVCCALFGSIAGTSSSAVAAIGKAMIPKMMDQGYPRGYSTALVGVSSILGQLIPPSVPGLIFALVTMQSVVACWLATVGAGLVTIATLTCINFLVAKRFPDLVVQKRIPRRDYLQATTVSMFRGLPVLLLPIIVLGGIYGGLTTPTEAAVLGVLYVIVAGLFVFRNLTPKIIGSSFIESASTTGVLVIMLIFVMITSRILILEGIPQELAAWIQGISSNPVVILILVNIFLLLVGMLMDDISGTLLAAPILLPVVEAAGIHPVQFAAILGLNLGIGNITPPTAPILFLAGHIGNSGMNEYLKPSLMLAWFGMVPVLLLVTFWPALSLFLPEFFGFL